MGYTKDKLEDVDVSLAHFQINVGVGHHFQLKFFNSYLSQNKNVLILHLGYL